MSQLVSRYIPAFPKPSQVEKVKPWIKVHRNGREVLDLRTPEGNAEYHRRKWQMWERQGGRCCFEGFLPECPGILRKSEVTFDHENKRGAGKHDDRIEVAGLWQNGAAHGSCNAYVGSRLIHYNASLQARKP